MMDDGDVYSAEKRLADVRGNQLSDWDWCHFCDDDYESSAEAYECYLIEIGGASMFNPGKIVIFRGMPSFHSYMADELHQIASNVLVVMICKIDKTTSLFSKVKAYEFGKVDERLALTDKNSVEWVTERAKLLGLRIDKNCCVMLSDACSYKPNAIHAELEKLRHAVADGDVTPQLIDLVTMRDGNANIFLLCDAIVDDNGLKAHEYLQRLITAGEDGIKMCGYFMDWARKAAIARASEWNPGPHETELKALRKADKNEDSGKTLPMFADLKGVYAACNKLRSKPPNWTYDLLEKVGRLQADLRKGGDQTLLLHRFVASLIREK